MTTRMIDEVFPTEPQRLITYLNDCKLLTKTVSLTFITHSRCKHKIYLKPVENSGRRHEYGVWTAHIHSETYKLENTSSSSLTTFLRPDEKVVGEEIERKTQINAISGRYAFSSVSYALPSILQQEIDINSTISKVV